MKKKTFLFLICMAFVGGIFAQTLPDGMITLLPEGVKANIDAELKGAKRKNLVVTGEKSKGYKAFFAASNEANGEELWVTDGTKAGTKMVKDIWPGSSGSDVNYIVRFNDKVVFAANDGTNEMELWISDGTEAGTHLVKDIHEFGSSDPRGFTQLNETQFIFCAKDFSSETYDDRGAQWWLYVSDGTEAGTELIYECDTKFPGSYATTWVTPYVRVGRKVFFKADKLDGEVGIELWVTDGTRAGTRLVKDINTEQMTLGTGSASIDQMVNFYNKKLFFQAWTIEYGSEPWATDGTEEGTYLIKDTDPSVNTDGKGVSGFVSTPGVYPYKGKVYYRGHSPEYGKELACTNLEPGDYTVFDINKNDPTSTNSSTPDPGIEFDGVYIFCATTGGDAAKPTNFGGENHYCDGETVKMQWDIAPGNLSHWVKDPIVVSGSMYWYNAGAAVLEDKEKLFRIDSKTSQPQRVTNFTATGDRIQTLRNLNGDLLFFTNDENKALYLYHYRKPGFDPVKDADLDRYLDFEPGDPTSEKEIKLSSTEIAIYPNPATDKFNFNVAGTCLSVKIFDLTGRMLKTENNLTDNSVNVNYLASGIYKVVITTTEGTFVASLIKE